MTAIREATEADAAALAALRALFLTGHEADGAFADEVATWLEEEGERRTTWLAERDGAALGMASLFEYRRMPKPGLPGSRWGYVSNMFVREEARDAGVGAALLDAVIAAADARGYARLVLSPAERAIPFYERAGFLSPTAAPAATGSWCDRRARQLGARLRALAGPARPRG